MPTIGEIAAAQRVLRAVRNNEAVRQPDALALRLWAGPGKIDLPLSKIAEKIIQANGKLHTHLPTQI